MNLEKLTNKSREALVNSQQIAIDSGNSELKALHVLAALVRQEGGLASSILEKLGVNRQLFANQVDSALAALPKVSGNGQLYQSQEFNRLLNDAGGIADTMHDEYISVEHLFLALFKAAGSEAETLLAKAGLTADKVLQALQGIRGNQRVTSADPEGTFEALKKYSRDLTLLAMQDKLDPVIGRDEDPCLTFAVLRAFGTANTKKPFVLNNLTAFC